MTKHSITQLGHPSAHKQQPLGCCLLKNYRRKILLLVLWRYEYTFNREAHLQSPTLCPPDSTWISCLTSTNNPPHSNECGPNTVLALSIMMSHPVPDETILLPYMDKNLTQSSRYWMSKIILAGECPLLQSNSDCFVIQCIQYLKTSSVGRICYHNNCSKQEISHLSYTVPMAFLPQMKMHSKGHGDTSQKNWEIPHTYEWCFPIPKDWISPQTTYLQRTALLRLHP